MSPGEGWIAAAKSRSVAEVAADLGMDTGSRGSIGPCPACGNTRRGKGKDDRRLPIVSIGLGWCCYADGCGAKGDVVDLVAWKLTGKPCKDLTPDERRPVREWFGVRGTAAPHTAGPAATPPPDYPPLERVRAYWSALPALPKSGVVTGAIRTPETAPEPDMAAFWSEWKATGRAAFWSPAEDGTAALVAWMRGRAIDPQRAALLDLVRPAPQTIPPRLAEGERAVRGYGWPYGAVVPLVDATGLLRSFLFRAVADPGKDWEGNTRKKSMGMRGYSRVGLVMADPMARAILSRTGDDPAPVDMGDGILASWNGDILICEGEPDYLTAAVHGGRVNLEDPTDPQTYAVIGTAGTSGGLPAEVAARLPKDARVLVYQHSDEAGRTYAAKVAESLRAVGIAEVEVVNLPAKDLNDVATGKAPTAAPVALPGPALP